jgi:hypothetical protein
MARPLVSATAAAIVLALVLLIPSPAVAFRGLDEVKFLFTPQAGYNSACLSCGWHDVCNDNWQPGPALDFPASCSGGQSVYLRNFGFMSGQSDITYVGYAAAYEVPDTTCKTVRARVWDTGGTVLGEMWYVHTYRTYPGTIWLYANKYRYENEQVVAAMAKDPDEDGGIPEYQKENEQCKRLGYWTGVHLHEEHKNYANTFSLRDHGNCEGDVTYPCGPQWPYPTYDPQDWENDWARALCIDDTDCDGWTDSAENIIGTDPSDDCPEGTWDDAWPPDNNNDAAVDILDVLRYKGKLQYCQPYPPYNPRYDLNADGTVDILDVLMYSSEDMGVTCTNP